MSATRYPGHLTWEAMRKAAAVLKAARRASRKRQEDVAAELGWSAGKVGTAENGVCRMTPADALLFAGAVGADLAEMGLGDAA